jgi:cytoskeletal protein CcmA (bactofilin family)
MRFLIALLLLFAQGWAEEAELESDEIVLPAENVHNGDYFAVGNTVKIAGTVNGDVYIAASQVIIEGAVNGDVFAAGGSVDISGTVTNNVRILSGQAVISGRIRENATLVVGQLILTSRAQIDGNLKYSSNQVAWIESKAIVGGKLIHQPFILREIFSGKAVRIFMIGSKIAALLMNFLYTFFIGWLLMRLYPKNVERALYVLDHRPWKACAYGILLLILLPLAALVLLMTILGTPFALTLLALNVIGFYTAKVFSILWASNHLFKKIGFKPNRLSTFCLGLILYFLITSIPFYGSLLAFIALIFGLGAAALSRTQRLRRASQSH